jgi:hypothetical protein
MELIAISKDRFESRLATLYFDSDAGRSMTLERKDFGRVVLKETKSPEVYIPLPSRSTSAHLHGDPSFNTSGKEADKQHLNISGGTSLHQNRDHASRLEAVRNPPLTTLTITDFRSGYVSARRRCHHAVLSLYGY